MKCIKLAAAIAAVLMLPMQMQGRDIKDLLKGLSNTSTTDTTSTTSGSGLGALGSIVSGLISKDNIDPKSMTGTWNYSSPAVCFKSDNL